MTFKAALSGEDGPKWEKAIENELTALEENLTWIEVPFTPDKQPLRTKWVFRVKQENEAAPLFKARLVVRGFEQKDEFDPYELYAPVAKLTTFRVLLAISGKFQLLMNQMDVRNAFLNGDINEDVYLFKPEGFRNNDETTVLKLCKSLYGLRKSPRYWNQKFHNFMKGQNFTRSESDWCLYFRKNDNEMIFLLLFVDDLIILGPNQQEIDELKSALNQEFKMKDLGRPSTYLGMNVILEDGKISLSQKKYLMDLLQKFNMSECNPAETPMDISFEIPMEPSSDKTLESRCRQLVGSLMYAVMCTRPDLAFTVGYLSRYQSVANEDLWRALKRILRYVKASLDLKLDFSANEEASVLQGYADADYAMDKEDRKSTSGYIFKVYGCTVSWSSRKQQTVAKSTTEAEYVALSEGTSEACWLRNLLDEIGLLTEGPTVIYEDNLSAIATAKNPEHHKRLKHVDIKHHFIREKIDSGVIDVKQIESKNQIADGFTKPLNKVMFRAFCKSIGLIEE